MRRILRTARGTRLLLCVIMTTSWGSAIYGQGGGDPIPEGSPGATMKTLEEIEPRVSLIPYAPDTSRVKTETDSARFEIRGPGSYYLTSNISANDAKDGILINSSNVVLDLNGFTINGQWNDGTGYGVIINGSEENVTIRNGTISSMPTGIGLSVFYEGNEPRYPVCCVVEGVMIAGSSTAGIKTGPDWLVRNCTLLQCQTGIACREGTRIENCTISGSTQYGIVDEGANLTVTGCTVRDSNISGINLDESGHRIERCTVTGAADDDGNNAGIRAGSGGQVIECVVKDISGNGIYGLDATLIKETLVSNNRTGIWLDNNCVVRDCLVTNNSFSGIYGGDFTTVIDTKTNGNGNSGVNVMKGSKCEGIEACNNGSYGIFGQTDAQLINCKAAENGNSGIYISSGGSVESCQSSKNAGHGIYAVSGCRIVNNTCYQNLDTEDDTVKHAGIYIASRDNVIDGNQVMNNNVGLWVKSFGNMITRNRASGNTIGYDVVANNALGEIEDTAGSNAVSGSSSPGSLRTTSPWANFSY